MAPPGKLDKYWIDNNFSYLATRLGLHPLFEPSGFFYDDLGQLGDRGDFGRASAKAAEIIFGHAGVPCIPVRVAPGMTNAGEFQFTQPPDLPGRIIPSCIKVSNRYTAINDPRVRGMAIGTILAHEIAHYCLMKKGVLRQAADNERLTDLALMVLGLGKLWFNGRDLVIEERREHLGYLGPLDMTYAYMQYSRHNGNSLQDLTLNLSSEARRLLLSWLDQVNAKINETRRDEELIEDEEQRLSAIAMQEQLEREVQKASGNIETLKISLATTAIDQDILNKIIWFWEIPPQDHGIMGEFVTALSSGNYESDIIGIRRSLDALRQEVMLVGTDLNPVAGKDWTVPLMKIADLAGASAALHDRILSIRLSISLVHDVHNRCFQQIGAVRKDLETTLSSVSSCRSTVAEIRDIHEFFLGNPAVWRKYTEDPSLVDHISGMLSSREQEQYLARTDQETARFLSVLSSPKETYAQRFRSLPGIREIARHALEVSDGALDVLQGLKRLHASQTAIIDAYLRDAGLLEGRLEDTLAAAVLVEKEILGLKQRQDKMNNQLGSLKIAPGDGAEFEAIIQAISSCSLDVDLVHSTRILRDIREVLKDDAGRVKKRSESACIQPMEVLWNDFYKSEAGIRQIAARLLRWKETQQIYLCRLEQIQQRMPRMFFRKIGTGIKDTLQTFGKNGAGKKK